MKWTVNLKSFEMRIYDCGNLVYYKMNYKLEKFWNNNAIIKGSMKADEL